MLLLRGSLFLLSIVFAFLSAKSAIRIDCDPEDFANDDSVYGAIAFMLFIIATALPTFQELFSKQ